MNNRVAKLDRKIRNGQTKQKKKKTFELAGNLPTEIELQN